MNCKNCGTQNTKNASFCKDCGLSLEHSKIVKTNPVFPVQSSPQKEESMELLLAKLGGSLFLVLLIFLLPLGWGAWYWYNHTHYNSAYENTYLSTCEATGASVSSCDCELTATKNNFTYSQSMQIESDIRSNVDSQLYQSWVSTLKSDCLGG